MNKKIVNIVFYQNFGTDDNTKKACIFYDDGTVANVGFEEGIDACEIIVKERNIKTKDAFREMINNDLVHVVTGEEFRRNYDKYFPMTNEEALSRDTNRNVPVEDIDTDEVEDEDLDEIDASTNTEENRNGNTVVVPIVAGKAVDSEDEDEDLVEIEDEDEIESEDENTSTDSNDNSDVVDVEGQELDAEIEEPKKKGFFARTWDKIKNNKWIKRIAVCATAIAIGLGLYSCHQRKTMEGQMANSNLTSISANKDNNKKLTVVTVDGVELKKGSNDYYDDYTFEQLLAVTDSNVQKRTMQNLDAALQGFNGDFADAFVEEGKDVRAALTFDEVIALQVAYNDYSKEDLHAIFNGADIRSNKLSRAYKDANLQLMGAHVIESSEHPVDMSMLIESEEGKEFYNKYHAAFLAAKEATGDEQIRLVTEFYNMVRSDFTVDPVKRTTGISHAEVYDIESYKLSVTPRVAAAEIMFQNLNVDVTLNDLEVDFFNNLGFCNMADAAFQRVETVTLANGAVVTKNCGETEVKSGCGNHKEGKDHHCCCCCDCHDEKTDNHGCHDKKETKQTETIVCGGEDDTNPLYEQYRSAIIKKYKDKGIYYIDDEHRELTKLDRFQEIVNGHRDLRCGGWRYNTWVEESTETHTEVTTRTETTTTYHEEETREEKEIPPEIKKQIDDEIADENEKAKREAEEAAERERQRIQKEEDENARRIEEEVRRDEEDLQRDIDEANRRIDENNKDQNPNNNVPVNESDFGDHNVDFDDDHSDSHGNLDSSVENITTDPTGDQTGQPLPDPNETGRQFDVQAPAAAPAAPVEHHEEAPAAPAAPVEHHEEAPAAPAAPVEHHEEAPAAPAAPVEHHEEAPSSSNDSWVETVQVSDDAPAVDEFWVEEESSPAKESSISYEDLVDEYVEFLAADDYITDEVAYQYTR